MAPTHHSSAAAYDCHANTGESGGKRYDIPVLGIVPLRYLNRPACRQYGGIYTMLLWVAKAL